MEKGFFAKTKVRLLIAALVAALVIYILPKVSPVFEGVENLWDQMSLILGLFLTVIVGHSLTDLAATWQSMNLSANIPDLAKRLLEELFADSSPTLQTLFAAREGTDAQPSAIAGDPKAGPDPSVPAG